ncbi:hypothetical protein O3P69_011057 [Scylla paramamosain]|uniref:Reverse transcriptase domain-containing protein n=1 Tax=Scylla paramamosain TaxID=85552 RepID=A0AAW0SSF8_SCYPA
MLGAGYSGIEMVCGMLSSKHFTFETYVRYSQYVIMKAVEHAKDILMDSRKAVFKFYAEELGRYPDENGCRDHLAARTKMMITEEEYQVCKTNHEAVCDVNYEGTSGGMEVSAAITLWNRSLKHNMRYMHFESNADSAAFNAVKNCNDREGVPSADILKRLATSKDRPLAPRVQRFLTVTAADTADSVITFLNLPTAASFNHFTDLPTAYAYLMLPQHHMLALFHSLKEELLFLIGTYSFIAASLESLKPERNAIYTNLPSYSDWLTHNLRWSAYGYKSFAKMAIPVAEKLGAVILLLRMDSLSYQRAPHLSDFLVYNDDIVGPAILPLVGKGPFDTTIRDHVLKVVPSSKSSSMASGSVHRKDRTPSTSRSADKTPQTRRSFRFPTIFSYSRAPIGAPPRSFITPPDSGKASEVREHEAPEGPNSTPPEELLNNTLWDRISPNRTPAERMWTAEPRPTPSFRTTAAPGSDAPGGRLTIFVDQWRSASRSIFNILKKGFHWTWQLQAPQLCTPTHLDSTPNPDLSLAVTDLLSKQAIYQVSPQPCFLSRVFLVPKQTGGLRFIINLTQLNKHIHSLHFHMSNHSVLADMLSSPAWTKSIDLSDAYFHVPIKATLHKYLAFTHDGKLFFFCALPFGLNMAPYIFTRILHYLLSLLHQQGIPVLAYIDDWIIWGKSPDLASHAYTTTASVLSRLGFLINHKKSQPVPTQDANCLGVRWITDQSLLGIPI